MSQGPCQQCGMEEDVETEEKATGVVAAVGWGFKEEEVATHQEKNPLLGPCQGALTEGRMVGEDELGGSEEDAKIRTEWTHLGKCKNVKGWRWVQLNGETQWLTYVPLEDHGNIIEGAHGGRLGGHLG